MAEYIVDTSKIEHVPWISKESAYTRLFGECGVPLYERIVRCKDCKCYEYMGITQGWINVCTRGGHMMLVTSDGFCAWGEER